MVDGASPKSSIRSSGMVLASDPTHQRDIVLQLPGQDGVWDRNGYER